MAVLRQAVQLNAKEDCEVVHEVADDLESFFYVFMWICVLHSGPNGAVCTPPENNTSIVQGWGEAAMTTGGLTHAFNAKCAFVHAPNKIIDEQFTPYFQNLTYLAKEWRALVKVEDDRRAGLNQAEPGPLLIRGSSTSFTVMPTPRPLCHKCIQVLHSPPVLIPHD